MSMIIDTSKVGATAKALSLITVTDATVTVSRADASRLAPASGEAVYITVRDGTNMERMLVTSVSGSSLIVQRGMDNTTAQTFRAGACISIEWNPAQLMAFLQQQTGTAAAGYTGVCTTPGVFTFKDGLLVSFSASEGC